MASLKVICAQIETLDELRSYEPIWRELFSCSAQPSVFASWDWFFTWWKHIGSDPPNGKNERFEGNKSPLLLVQVKNAAEEVVALIPLYWAFNCGHRLRLRMLRMVGELESAENNPNEEPIVLLRRGCENAAITALRRYLRFRPTGTDWVYASIAVPTAGVKSNGVSYIGRVNARLKDRMYRRYVRTTEILSLPKDWEVFRRTLTKSMRDNLKYYPRLIERHGHNSAIRVARTVQEMDAASSVLTNLHRLRTTASHGVPHLDHLPTEAHRVFLQEAHEALSAQGHALIYILSIDGLDIAAQSVLEGPEGYVFYYSGFDPDWHRYSPLTILAAEILKEAINNNVTSVNFLHFPRLWKSRWGARSIDRSERITCLRLHIPSLVKFVVFHGVTRHSRRPSAVQPEAMSLSAAGLPLAGTDL